MTPIELMKAAGINPQPTTHAEYLSSWEQVQSLAKAFSAMEMTMRKALFKATFPQPKEGANSFVLEDGRKIAATHKINRSIDVSQIALARSEYELANERPVEIDGEGEVDGALEHGGGPANACSSGSATVAVCGPVPPPCGAP